MSVRKNQLVINRCRSYSRDMTVPGLLIRLMGAELEATHFASKLSVDIQDTSTACGGPENSIRSELHMDEQMVLNALASANNTDTTKFSFRRKLPKLLLGGGRLFRPKRLSIPDSPESPTLPPPRGNFRSVKLLVRRRYRHILRALTKKLRVTRTVRTTTHGKLFIFMTVGVGLAAVMTGNNMLFLILGTLLALILVSGVMSELSLQNLSVSRRLPRRAQAGHCHVVEIEVINKKSRVSSFAIEVEDIRSGQPTDKRCFFLKISSNSSQVAAYRRKPFRRGVDYHTGFRVATKFPFGLFEKSLYIPMANHLVIYPSLIPGFPLPSRQTNHDTVDQYRGAAMNGDELDGVKPFRDGDDPRCIYWPKSTRPDAHVVKQRSPCIMHSTDVVLDDMRPAGSDRESWDAQFEQRICVAASSCVALVRAGHAVRLVTASAKRCIATPATGADPVLRFLALLQPTDQVISDVRDTALNQKPPETNIFNDGLDAQDCGRHPMVQTISSDSISIIVPSEPKET